MRLGTRKYLVHFIFAIFRRQYTNESIMPPRSHLLGHYARMAQNDSKSVILSGCLSVSCLTRSQERTCEGLRTSNLVNGWSTTTRITDMRGDIEADSSGSLFKSPLAGSGGIFIHHLLRQLAATYKYTVKYSCIINYIYIQ